jgi:hypothetical protein
MATYRIELQTGNFPKGNKHKSLVSTMRETFDALRHDRLVMQKALGNDNPALAASYERIATLFGVDGIDQNDKNAQAKRLYDELTGFFTALDAAGGDSIRGYLGLVG